MTYFETMLLPMQNLFHCLTRQMLTTNLPFSLRGKGEFERAKAQKARSLGVLARLKSPFPIKRLQRRLSTVQKTHLEVSRALEPIVLLKPHQVEDV